MTDRGDTIFALATARGKSGVAVLRVSGPAAHEVARALCGSLPGPRRASLRRLVADGEMIDEALVVVFEEKASFTGEASVEFQVHGSAAVVRRLEQVIGAFPGCRMAEAGEFTRRALENGRLDLSQVEGLADLIAAETEAQLRQAQRAVAGELGLRVERWRAELIKASALIEASIDFSDEDVPDDLIAGARPLIHALVGEWQQEAAGAAVAERIRDGFEVAVVGVPNAGKSTLINYLAKRDVALTSELPGTTRDILEVRMDLGGLPVTFLDTAGIRDSGDEIEAAGVERARARARSADLRLYLDGSAELFDLPTQLGDLFLHGKCDLGRGPGLNVSGRTGEGVDAMLAAVSAELETRAAGSGVATRERHRRGLVAAAAHAKAALLCLEEWQIELAADDLRAARHELDMLIGRVDVEEILGHIFASFCIGK